MAAEKVDARGDGLLRPPHQRSDLHAGRPASASTSCDLPLMVADNTETPAHRVHRDGRLPPRHAPPASRPPTAAATVRACSTPDTRPEDLARPGHIFPLRYREGGVLKRAGHTEAAVDLARLAGLQPAGVLGEVVNDDGTMARLPRARGVRRRARPAAHHHRRPHPLPPPARRSWCAGCAEARLPTRHGDFTGFVYERCSTAPSTWPSSAARCRGRTTCSSGCTASASPATCSGRCAATAGCQLDAAMAAIAEEGHGVVVYLRGPRGSRHRHRPQAPGLHAAGRGPRHRRRQRGARLPRRLAASTASGRRSSSTSASRPCGS